MPRRSKLPGIVLKDEQGRDAHFVGRGAIDAMRRRYPDLSDEELARKVIEPPPPPLVVFPVAQRTSPRAVSGPDDRDPA